MTLRREEPKADTQEGRYLDLLRSFPVDGLTDWEAARLMGIDRTSVTARRAVFVQTGQVYAAGSRIGPSGTRNRVWKAR
jgi:hypothetical protein